MADKSSPPRILAISGGLRQGSLKLLAGRLLLVTIVAGTLVIYASTTSCSQNSSRQFALAEALRKEDIAAIRAAVVDRNLQLGDKAGVPEVADKYLPIPKAGKWLSPQEARPGLEPWFQKIESARWWKIGLDPTKLDRALREPAAVIAGNLAAYRAKLQGADRSLAIAKDAADFLLWAQERAGTGVFPFPAARGVTRDNAFVAATRYINRAEREGRLGEVVRQGWAVNDDGDGGLQFDNGECGVAVFELYEITKDKRYLDASKKAADWALAHPLVSNWNYNSFSVYLLARAYRVTGEKKYLAGATKKAMLGIIPGQLTQGPNAGRWYDAHNARPAYHYILLRGLAELLVAMPKSDPARGDVVAALSLGLKNRNQDLLERGAANKDKAVEVLILVNHGFANDLEFLRTTRSADALDAIGKLISEQSRRGNAPLGPREWGQFLEYVTWKGDRRSGR
jgi:hypothetical protein